MRVTLTVEEGPHQGATFAFEGHDLFLVGRSKRAHFRLHDKDRSFSRVHFMVEVNPPLCRITDMQSRNGTFVNGQRVQAMPLRHGDRIQAGHTLMRVEFEGAPPDDDKTLLAAADPGTEEFDDPRKKKAPAPPRLPGLELLRELGRGGMGIVYEAKRDPGGEEVAVKTIAPAAAGNPRNVERFLREAEILQQLDHENIVRFYGAGQSEGLLYFAMELVQGTDLQRVMEKQGKLRPTVAVRVMSQVLSGLAHAHAKGFVHRDIKPANVLVGKRPDGRRWAKLADFGLGRIYRDSVISGVTLFGEIGGTPHFMAPEQITNYRDVSPAADQYSCAGVLYHLLTGAYPRDLPPMPRALTAILEEDPVPLRERAPALPEVLGVVIHRALARDPSERYRDADEFRRALTPFGG